MEFPFSFLGCLIELMESCRETIAAPNRGDKSCRCSRLAIQTCRHPGCYFQAAMMEFWRDLFALLPAEVKGHTSMQCRIGGFFCSTGALEHGDKGSAAAVAADAACGCGELAPMFFSDTGLRPGVPVALF
jgi:hypothetical protein